MFVMSNQMEVFMVECYFSTEIGVDVEHRFVLLLAIIKIRLFMSERMCI